MGSRRPGRYETVQSLGTGPYAEALLARDHFGGDRLVVLKVLDQTTLSSRAFTRIQRELMIRRGLRHPHLGALLDLDFDDAGGCRLVSEYIPGPDFIAANPGQDEALLVGLAAELLQALGHLHDCGLVHGAIKPRNVLVTTASGSPSLRLVDFDLRPDHEISPAAPAATLWYAAPEVLRGRAADTRSDLYGVGMLLFHAIAGKLPFDDSAHGPAVVAWHLSRDVVRSPGTHPIAPIVEQLLDPDPDRRFPSTHEVIRAIATATGRRLRSRSTLGGEQVLIAGRFVGRDRESRRLLAACRRILNGGGAQLFLLTGPQGMGKTRALEECRIQAQMSGIRVARAVCRRGRPAPLGVVRELVHQLVVLLGADSPAAESYRGILEDVMPGSFGAGVARRAVSDAGQDWLRIKNGIAEFLAATSQLRPLLLILDDIQCIDEASLSVVRWLFQHFAGSPIMLLGAMEESDRDDAGGAAARAVENEAHEVLRLTPLSSADVEQMLSGVLALPGNVRELTGLVLRLTGGVPLYVEELLRALLDGQMLEMLAQSGLSVAEESPLEARERAVGLVRARVDRLPDPVRAVLDALELFDGAAREPEIAAATVLRGGEIDSAVRRLETVDLVRLEPTPSGLLVTVRSSLFRDAVARGIPPARLASMHDGMVDHIEASETHEPSRISAVAYHAIRGTRPARLLAACTAAAREAMALHAFGRARELLEKARRSASELGDREAAHDVLGLLAETLQRLGDLEAALSVLAELAGSPDAPRTSVVRARLAAAGILVRLARFPAADAMVDAASREASDLGDPLLVARSRRCRAALHLRLGATPQALALLQEARELLGPLDAAADFAAVAAEIGEAHALLDEPALARRWHEESLARCLALHDRAGIARAHLNIGLLSWKEGRSARAIARFRRAETIARRLGHYPLLARAMQSRGAVEAGIGRLADAVRTLTHAVHLMRRLEDETGLCDALEQLGIVHHAAGRHEMARLAVEDVIMRRGRLNDLQGVASARVLVGRILATIGAFDECETLLRTAADAAQQLGMGRVAVEALLALAEVAAKRDRPDEAAGFLDRLARTEGVRVDHRLAAARDVLRCELALESDGRAIRAQVARILRGARAIRNAEACAHGRRLAARGRPPGAALASLRASARVADRAGLREIAWRVRADLGKRLLGDGRIEEASRVLREAMKILRALHDELPPRRREGYLADPCKQEVRAAFAETVGRIGVGSA